MYSKTLLVSLILAFALLMPFSSYTIEAIRLSFRLASIGIDISSRLFLNKEDEMRSRAINAHFTLIAIQDKFKNCLVKNKDNNPEESIPSVCQEQARMLIMLGKKEELDRITDIYQTYKKHYRH